MPHYRWADKLPAMELDAVHAVNKHFSDVYFEPYRLNDRAHQEEHFYSVLADGIEMNHALKLDCNVDMIAIVAWTHDMFAWSRENHHILAESWVRSTNDPVIAALTDKERDMVATACLEHRASSSATYSSVLSELMASADRGKPVLAEKLSRAYVFAKDAYNMSDEDAFMKSITHVREKFGRNGYQALPELYTRYYERELEAMYTEIDQLTAVPESAIWLVRSLSLHSNKT